MSAAHRRAALRLSVDLSKSVRCKLCCGGLEARVHGLGTWSRQPKECGVWWFREGPHGVRTCVYATWCACQWLHVHDMHMTCSLSLYVLTMYVHI